MKALISSILFIAASGSISHAQSAVTETIGHAGIGPCFATVKNTGPLYIIQCKKAVYQLLSVEFIEKQEIEKMDVKTNMAENTAIYGSKASNGLVIFTIKPDKELAVIKRLDKNLIKL